MCPLAKNAYLTFGQAGFPTNYVDMGTQVEGTNGPASFSLPLQVSDSSMITVGSLVLSFLRAEAALCDLALCFVLLGKLSWVPRIPRA